MIWQNKIGLDIDGVVGDFYNHFFNYLGLKKHPPMDWDDERFDLYPKIEKDVDFWMSMPHLVHQDQLNFTPIYFVTARTIDERFSENWLKKAGFKNPIVFNTKDKFGYVKNLDIFVDDAPHNFIELSQKGVNVLLQDQPYNQHIETDKRIFDLKTL